jgi:hypothetical protein
MQDIHYNNKIYVIPDNWNELSGKQLIKVAGYLNGKNNNPELVELKILKALMCVSAFKFGYLSNDLKARLLPYIQWIVEDANTLTENTLYCYRKNIFSKKLYAPEKEFNNLRMVEFHYTEVAYKFLRETDDIDYLNELVAILYRQGKTNYDFNRNVDGDVREAFNDAVIEQNKKIVSKWPLAVKQAILLWYDGCRQLLIEDYPLVYSGKKSTENYYAGLYNMIRSVAGEKYGTMDKVEQLTVHTAHLELTCIIEDAQRLEEAYKKQA